MIMFVNLWDKWGTLPQMVLVWGSLGGKVVQFLVLSSNEINFTIGFWTVIDSYKGNSLQYFTVMFLYVWGG